MAKVLVAGAGGYLGIPLCKKLIERDHSLIALDRFFFGRDRLDEIACNERAAVIVEDIRDFDPEILTGVDVVVDLAGLSNDASAEIDPELTRLINCGAGYAWRDWRRRPASGAMCTRAPRLSTVTAFMNV